MSFSSTEIVLVQLPSCNVDTVCQQELMAFGVGQLLFDMTGFTISVSYIKCKVPVNKKHYTF